MGVVWVDKKQLVIDIWVRLRDGASPASLASEFEPSQRTIERFRQVAEAIENRLPVGEIMAIGGWKPEKVANLKRFHQEFLNHYPTEQNGNQSDNLPFLDRSTKELWEIISTIIDSMWVPSPDEVSISFEGGPGFRTAKVGGLQFCWTQGMQERITSGSRGKRPIAKKFLGLKKVWFSDSEEAAFFDVLRFLEEARGRPIVARYEKFQGAVIEYLKSSIRYQRERVESGWNSINDIWAAERTGKINREDPYIAPGFTLMHEYPHLDGLVEEFKKDLRQIVFSKVL